MKLDTSTLCTVLAAWLVLTGVAHLQRASDMELAAADMHRAAVSEAKAEAEIMGLKVLCARGQAGTELDEVTARSVVFETMERKRVRSCAVLVGDRLLEAQTHTADGRIAPLAELPDKAHTGWSLTLREGEEVVGRVWVETDPLPWQKRLDRLENRTLWHFVAVSQGGGVVLFLIALLSSWLFGRPKSSGGGAQG